APSAPPAPVRRVLFVGDSLTYVNDLDLHVRHFAEAAGYASPSLFIDRAVKGGAPLKTLWKKTDARQRIAKEGFDVVVLQEDLPETDVATFHDYAARFHEHCQAAGAATVLLMAWPYERLDWISTEGIAEAHGSIASRLGASLPGPPRIFDGSFEGGPSWFGLAESPEGEAKDEALCQGQGAPGVAIILQGYSTLRKGL
ncbi:unnamed protein product, partial [Polarella glacialis]